jgi:hypothetical protein
MPRIIAAVFAPPVFLSSCINPKVEKKFEK